MLRIIKFTDKPCFMTHSRGDSVVQFKFDDGSLSGCLRWDQLLKVIQDKVAAENNEIKRETQQSKSTSVAKPS